MLDACRSVAGGTAAAALEGLSGQVRDLAVPIEGVFVAIGDELAAALGVLGTLQADFAALSSRLESDAARQAEQAFGESLGQCTRLGEGASRTAERLAVVERAIALSAAPLRALRMILTEVGALAINAKIQAVQVRAASVDFAVFTTEMARLHHMAEQAVSQASQRHEKLGGLVAAAQSAEGEFRGRDADELDKIRVRLERGLAAFAERRRRSGGSMASMGARSEQIARRVGECVTQMQINDLTRQRIEHVHEALALVAGIDPGGGENRAWFAGLEDGRQGALIAAVCRLQAEQLQRAAADFAAEVTRMKTNLEGLATDAGATGRAAAELFGGAGDGGSFLQELGRDVDEASRILDAYAAANTGVRDAIIAVMDGFDAVAGDIHSIHSIDADMRIMGLNASLKCGRLGGRGRALGVVAQELRGCSRRTQEHSDALAETMVAARDDARLLAQWVEDGQAQAATLRSGMAESMHSLAELGTSLQDGLNRLVSECARLSQSLARAADGICIHHHTQAEAGRIAAALAALADTVAAGDTAYDGIEDDVARLLAGRYTMASERVIHGMAGSAPADDCDDFFL